MPMLQANLFKRTWPLTVFATDWTFEEYRLPCKKNVHMSPSPSSQIWEAVDFLLYTNTITLRTLLPLGFFLKKNIFYSPKNRFLESTIPLS